MMSSHEFDSQEQSHSLKDIYATAHKLKLIIKLKTDVLVAILSEYQTEEVSRYEIDRCLKTLDGLQKNSQFFATHKKTDCLAILLPTNLPLYSLLLFALIPSFQAQIVNVRPNAILQERNIISRIFDALELSILFPGIRIRNQNHADFEPYISAADLVVFTGKPLNGTKITKKMKKNSLLVINGAGHNPLIITESADIDKAIEGALLVKGFNGGQDCAGPDAILVHESIASQFIDGFQKKFTNLKTGEFKNPDVQIGPIHRFDEIKRLASILHENRKHITAGGQIDFKNGIVYPTVIVRNIEDSPNYQEVYGPIAFIHPYRSDNDLAHYFKDLEGKYQANRMYVSVYGHSPYASQRDDTKNPGGHRNIGIVLTNKTIHDIEIGYNPYGGYSIGASGVVKNTEEGPQHSPMPILLPQIIHDYILENKSLPKIDTSKESDEASNPLISDFRRVVRDTLKDSIVFGFIFGSVAKNKSRHHCENASDIDTFICLKNENLKIAKDYIDSLSTLHKKHGLHVDKTFPAEIMTFETLKNMAANLHTLNVSINTPLTGVTYDHVFWSCVLNDKKAGFIGDGDSMASIVRQARSHVFRWSEQIIAQIRLANSLPAHIREKFPTQHNADIIESFSKMPPSSVIQHGLMCDNSMSIINKKLELDTVSTHTPSTLGDSSVIGIHKFFNQGQQSVPPPSPDKTKNQMLHRD